MESDIIGQILMLVILISLSAFFSMSETALTSLSKIKLQHMLEEDIKGVKAIEVILRDPKKMLNTVLIGNNAVNSIATALSTSLAIKIGGNKSLPITISTIAITIIILIFSEITPKNFAVQNQEKISLLVAKPLKFFMAILSPLASLINIVTNFLISLMGGTSTNSNEVTESDVKAIIKIGHEQGVINVDEKILFDNVFDFGDSVAKDVMTPRTDVVAISDTDSNDEIQRVYDENFYTKILVYHENIDNVVGFLNLRDFAFSKGEFNIETAMKKPYFTYETKPIKDLFREMKQKKVSIAIVLDEYAGTSGIITIEDLVSEIIDVSTEHDKNIKDIENISTDGYLIDGSTKIEHVNDMLGINLQSDDFESIGGYVIGVAGRFPKKGEVIEDNNMKFTVEEIEHNRILELKIHLSTESEDSNDYI